MRYYYLILPLILLTSTCANAQLNYLFSAEKKTYVPVNGGTTPHMITDYAPWEVEDEGFASIPIGFKFNYSGTDYSKVNVSANGFVTLGDTFTTRFNAPLFTNSIGSGPFSFGGERPVIAPFWDDLLLTDTLNLVYKTSGQRPHRVFTIEWKKVKWVYESLAPVLSIELKLYEGSNVIEFHYKDEGSLPDARFAFASIGITSAYENRGFISLQSTSSHPDISLLKPNDSLTIKPATNQLYRFTPASVDIPDPLQSSIVYTNQTVSFDLDSDDHNGYHGNNHRESADGNDKDLEENERRHHRHDHYRHDNYEYAITQSPIVPSSGRRSSSSDITISSLSPATTYYLYARSIDRGDRSQWTAYSFTTAIAPLEAPYHVSGIVPPGALLPSDLRVQNFMDTSHAYFPSSDLQIVVDFPAPEDTTIWELNLNSYNADSWVYTPGIKLTAGKTYQLKFSYVSYYTNAPGEPSALVVKYGKAVGEDAMRHRLFKDLDIRTYADYDEFGGLPKSDTVIEFTPYHSDEYYFGFHNLTPLDGAVLMLSNISITEKDESGLKEVPVTLNGNSNKTDNILNWEISGAHGDDVYEMQRSTDGVNFTKAGNVQPDATEKTTASKKSMHYRIAKNSDGISFPKGSKQVAATDSKLRAGFEMQRSTDGINFTKVTPSTGNNTHSAPGNKSMLKTKFDFTDHPANDITYYRVQRIGNDKKISYSNVVKLGIKDLQQFRVTGMYPNPAKDLLNISISSSVAGKMNIAVSDLSGKIMIIKSIQSSRGQNNFQLAVSSSPSGIYLLKIVCGDGCENTIKKFIKE